MIAHFVIRPCEREALDKVWCNREARPVLHTGSRRQKRLSLIPSNSIVSWEVMLLPLIPSNSIVSWEVMLLPCILFVYRDVGKTWMFCIRKTVARACVQRLCLVVGDAAYSVKRLTRTTRNIATAKPMLMKLARSTKTFCTSESLA